MEQEVRLIDADKLKQHYAWWENGTAEMTLAEAKRNFDVIIDVQPTVDAEPVRHGRWIKNEDRCGWHCSCCGKDDLYAYPYTQNNERELQDFYCPNCGAKMDGERREDDNTI